MKIPFITKWLLPLVFVSAGQAFAGTPQAVLATLNIHADDAKGDDWRSLVLMDVATDTVWRFPLRSIAGGPVAGQPMHAVISHDKKSVYVTMGGNKELPLRLVTVAVDWSGTAPTVAVARTTEVLSANTVAPHGPGMLNMGMTGMDHAMQEGHGPNLSPDGRLLFFSELNNHRLRVFDTRTGAFVGQPVSNAALKTPHGVYPNPSLTRAMSTQYQLDGNQVSLWKMNPATGELTFERAITLAGKKSGCAFTHTAVWLNDNQFYTGCSQERNQGTANKAERSVWWVDAARGSARPVLDARHVLEGVSDVTIAHGKLYVAEGNVVKEGVPPGHVSIWNVRNPLKPVFIKRFSAGQGLPSSFGDAHELAATPDGHHVYAQSYRSGHLVKIDSRTDKIERVWSAAEGLPMPHGLSAK